MAIDQKYNNAKEVLIMMEIGGVSNIKWYEEQDGVMKSSPSLETSGYVMNFLYIAPGKKYSLKVKEFVICLLRGSIVSEPGLSLRESLLFKEAFSLTSEENGCLLFVCSDEGDNHRYLDEISGLPVRWVEYDTNMYKTLPQIYADKYRVNLWYLGRGKHGGIHNHSNEPIPFVEFHTQLRGSGWMVKYEDKEGKRELEKIKMVRGYTHDLFCAVEERKPIYPWHEYIAGENGSLFIVFEDTVI